MRDLLKRLERNIRERGLFRRGERILVAVSGGLDSMVLLVALHELAASHQWRLSIAHLNHRLRGRSSQADERLVRNTATALEVPFLHGQAEVRARARAGGVSLEMAAREARHEFLAEAASRTGSSCIALAHHAEDQVELFFLRLLRGSGAEGLSGMRWSSPSPANPKLRLVRPFLEETKATLRAFAREEGLRFREDPTNAAVDFRRNWVRHKLLPLLRGECQPALDRAILRLMSILQADADCIDGLARAFLEASGASANRGRRRESVSGEAQTQQFAALPVAVQRRCVQLQLIQLGVTPEYQLIERLRTLSNKPVGVRGSPAEGEKPGSSDCGLLAVCASDGRVRLVKPSPDRFEAGSRSVELSGGAGEEVVFGGLRIRWQRAGISSARFPGAAPPPFVSDRADYACGQEAFDADRVGARIVLRHWRPGDRFQPSGMGTPVKLQDLFTNAKVRRELRRGLVVAETANGELFWVERLRISEQFKLSVATKHCLIWRWIRA